MTEIRFDLKTPCKNCPFRNDSTRIVFACLDRAMEIEEGAYRSGFPCHLSAVHEEETEFRPGGFVFSEGTQALWPDTSSCNSRWGWGEWPGIDNDEDLYERLCEQVDWDAPVFDSAEDFFEANKGEE